MGRRLGFLLLLPLLSFLLFAGTRDFREDLLLSEEKEFRSLFDIHLQYTPSVFSQDPLFRSRYPRGQISGMGIVFLTRERFQVSPRLLLAIKAKGELEKWKDGDVELVEGVGIFDLGVLYQVTDKLAVGVEGMLTIATPTFPETP